MYMYVIRIVPVYDKKGHWSRGSGHCRAWAWGARSGRWGPSGRPRRARRSRAAWRRSHYRPWISPGTRAPRQREQSEAGPVCVLLLKRHNVWGIPLSLWQSFTRCSRRFEVGADGVLPGHRLSPCNSFPPVRTLATARCGLNQGSIKALIRVHLFDLVAFAVTVPLWCSISLSLFAYYICVWKREIEWEINR